MARNSNANAQVAQQLAAAFSRLPWKAKVGIVVLLLVGGIVFYFATRNPSPPADNQPDEPKPTEPSKDDSPPPSELVNVPPPAAAFPDGSTTVTFCFWNMENLFDDKPDRRSHVADKEYDGWFATDNDSRDKKYKRLTEILLKFNKGNGPDIIVGVEIESYRAAELLKDTLNANLPKKAPKYEYVAMKELNAGRHIAPCVISRYPLSGEKLLGRLQRILEVRVTVNRHELMLIASHWTSQLTDKGDKEDGGRAKYAATIAEAYHDVMQASTKADFLVCGDFNDSPESDPVYRKLRMVGDSKQVTTDANPPKLFGLLSGKSPADFGTHYYNKPLIYDHVGISPGMFDNAGWGYVPDSVQVPTDGLIRSNARTRRPWRFGSQDDDAVGRGYSDHFPVLVTLKVAP